jgi:hypothetical protein
MITLGTTPQGEESIAIFNDISRYIMNPSQKIVVKGLGCLCELDLHPVKKEFVVITTSGMLNSGVFVHAIF